MSTLPTDPSAPPAREVAASPGERWLPLVLVAASILPHLRAVWPGLTYYFRDFTVTFYPMRLFWARELAAGRWPWWNPYVYEGAPALPVLYPPDLLHALWPSPAFVSWLLTLHFPLAALAAYALARDLGLGRAGAFAAGAVFSLSGLCLSSLNLYVFLQALALAPLVVLSLRRGAVTGGRWVPAAAAILAVSVSTLAVEFVAQAVALGAALGLADRPRARAAARLALALVLGAGLAAVPVLVTAGILGESVRGAGFVPEVALGNAVHPVVLLQALVPDLFGSLSAPVEAWWGGQFFSKGFPYLLSVYLGPLALALAVTGALSSLLGRRRTAVLLAAGGLALWYSFGERALLAGWVAALPGSSSFRFPSKALMLPVLVVAVLAGAGADRLSRAEGWRDFARACVVVSLVPVSVAAVLAFAAPAVARWAAVPDGLVAPVRRTLMLQGGQVALVALAGALLGALVCRARLGARPALALVATLLVGDLAQAGAGLNPQASPALFALLPELAAQRLNALEGGRVFSYGLDESPAFRGFLASGAPGRGLWSFFLSRQMLVPYASAIDRVETAHGKDLTSFLPRPPEMEPGELDPAAAGSILERLRQAAVVRVLSLDPLEDPGLSLRVRAPAGPPGLWVHVYELSEAAPRTALSHGTWRVSKMAPGEQEYEVEATRATDLVVRESHARGWRAWVDGREVPVRKVAGKYRAAGVAAGRHHVRFAYAPPGLRFGLAWMAVSLLAAAALWRKPLV